MIPISKPYLIGGGVVLAALAYMALSPSSAHAAQNLPPRPPAPPPPEPQQIPETVIEVGPGVVEIPEVVVYGDPAAIAFSPDTLHAALAADAAVESGHADGCRVCPDVLAFQRAYNLDPVSKHPENMLGTPDRVVYSLAEDGKFGQNSAVAVMYGPGAMPLSRC